MKSKESEYKRIIETYRRLGKQYIRDIEGMTPGELPEFVKLLPSGGRILDVGCAAGRDSRRFVRLGLKVTGIDLVAAFLNEAKKNTPGAEFLKMDLRKLRFPDEYFDAVWANAILLHVRKRDIPEVLRGFHRILKRGGKLHVRVKKGRGMRYEGEELSGGEKRLFTYFSQNEIGNFVKGAGFRVNSSKLRPDESPARKRVIWISLSAVRI